MALPTAPRAQQLASDADVIDSIGWRRAGLPTLHRWPAHMQPEDERMEGITHQRSGEKKPPTTKIPLSRVGLALGGGAARGWAHIGILSALAERGIEPGIVCGTSMGALVGGIYSAGKLDDLEAWVRTLTRREVVALIDFSVGGGGVIAGRRLVELYRRHLGTVAIEDLPRKFAAVATDLRSGSEVWLQDGPLEDAIRSSISIPGVFTPVYQRGRWLVDGGVVNPIPVNLCRALGAEIVIAVDLMGAGTTDTRRGSDGEARPAVVRGWGRWMHRSDESPAAATAASDDGIGSAGKPPGFASVVQSALDIMQIRISRSRLAGDPPDLRLTPRVLQVNPMEFSGGEATIEEGKRVVRRMMPLLTDLLGIDPG